MATIDEQVEWWLKQAEHDLEVARANQRDGFHDACALMCQQAAEKFLKALYIKTHQKTPPKTHVLDRLATALGAPTTVLDASTLLETDYMAARYPDIAGGVPYEQFDNTTSQERMQAVGEVKEWVLQQLGRTP